MAGEEENARWDAGRVVVRTLRTVEDVKVRWAGTLGAAEFSSLSCQHIEIGIQREQEYCTQ